MARRARTRVGVIGEHDRLDGPRPGSVGLMTDRADGARVRLARRHGRILCMGGKRAVAGLAADLRVRIGLTGVGHVGMALDAGTLTGVGDRSRGNLHERACPVVAESSVIRRNEQRPKDDEHKDARRKNGGDTQQVFVGSKRRHDAGVFGKRGTAYAMDSYLDFSRSPPRSANFSATMRKIQRLSLFALGGHVAGPEILDRQLHELEAPWHVLTVPADLQVSALVDQICTEFGLKRPRSRGDGR
jgi:hypothetical protein